MGVRKEGGLIQLSCDPRLTPSLLLLPLFLPTPFIGRQVLSGELSDIGSDGWPGVLALKSRSSDAVRSTYVQFKGVRGVNSETAPALFAYLDEDDREQQRLLQEQRMQMQMQLQTAGSGQVAGEVGAAQPMEGVEGEPGCSQPQQQLAGAPGGGAEQQPDAAMLEGEEEEEG
jgi:hypothetical protein